MLRIKVVHDAPAVVDLQAVPVLDHIVDLQGQHVNHVVPAMVEDLAMHIVLEQGDIVHRYPVVVRGSRGVNAMAERRPSGLRISGE